MNFRSPSLVAQAAAHDTERARVKAKRRALKKAHKAFRNLSKFGDFSITLTEEQLRKIDEARAKGEEVKITVSL